MSHEQTIHLRSQARRLVKGAPEDLEGLYVRAREGDSRESRKQVESEEISADDLAELEDVLRELIKGWVEERSQGPVGWMWVELMPKSGSKPHSSTLAIPIGSNPADDVTSEKGAMAALAKMAVSCNDLLARLLEKAMDKLDSALEDTTEALVAAREAEVWEEAARQDNKWEAMAETINNLGTELGPGLMDVAKVWSEVAQTYVQNAASGAGDSGGEGFPAPPSDGAPPEEFLRWFKSLPEHVQRGLITPLRKAAAAKPSKPKTSKPVHRPPSASSEPTPDQADEDDDEPTPSEDPGGEDGD